LGYHFTADTETGWRSSEGPTYRRLRPSASVQRERLFLWVTSDLCLSVFVLVRYNPASRVGNPVGKRMAKQLHKLSPRAVATVSTPGRHSDGGGLYLNVTGSGARSWVFMWKVAGRRHEIGLGSLRDIPLAKARDRAAEARRLLAEGLDPLAARTKPRTMSFGEAADALVESMSPSWRNEKHGAQWKMTLMAYCGPIRSIPVGDISTEDVLRVLRPIWLTKSETASRLRGRIERVLDFAKARGMRSGENPARWRGHLDAVLPRRQKLTRGHHKAMPFDEVPAFVSRLRGLEGVAPRALEFLILTAGRTGEVLGATWEEIDFTSGIWGVPAKRMKAGREHRVPLSDRALAILAELSAVRTGEYVFPGLRRDKPLSNMAMEAVLRRMAIDATVHGFRSAFRDWAGERTHFAREIAEAALAHLVGDAVERAYRRGDALQKRRDLMGEWMRFCSGGSNILVLAHA
jgi:integrase